MQDAFVWGSIIMKYSYIAFAFSALAAYIAMKYGWKEDTNELGIPILDDITNISFWALLIWKFSVIIFNPINVYNNPYYILYFDGGERGLWLAAVAVFIFLMIQSRRRSISIWNYAATVAAGFLAYKLAYSLLQLLLSGTIQTLPYDLSQFFISLTLLIWLYLEKESFRQPYVIIHIVQWFSIGQIFSIFLHHSRISVFLGLSNDQLLFMIITVCCLVVQKLSEDI